MSEITGTERATSARMTEGVTFSIQGNQRQQDVKEKRRRGDVSTRAQASERNETAKRQQAVERARQSKLEAARTKRTAQLRPTTKGSARADLDRAEQVREEQIKIEATQPKSTQGPPTKGTKIDLMA